MRIKEMVLLVLGFSIAFIMAIGGSVIFILQRGR